MFLAGFFCKRANAKGCLYALLAGPIWATIFTLAEHFHWVPWAKPIPFLFRAGLDFVVCCIVIFTLRTRGSVIPAQAIVDRSFPPEVAAYMKTIPWWRSFPFWATVLAVCVVALDVRFF